MLSNLNPNAWIAVFFITALIVLRVAFGKRPLV